MEVMAKERHKVSKVRHLHSIGLALPPVFHVLTDTLIRRRRRRRR